MKYKFILTFSFVLITFFCFSQRGPEYATNVSFIRNSTIKNQNGFDFTGVKFGHQFVNCGGNVQVGINYSKNANFTNYWHNGTSYSKQTIGTELWPKSNEVEINTVQADLYFGNQNLGRVKLNYIVGNFAGCFGETYDVLKQVGKNSSLKEYKDNINNLRLQNIVILSARAIGLWREPKINNKLKLIQKQKEQGKINERIKYIVQEAERQNMVGNHKFAKQKFQEAYKLKPSKELQAQINKTNDLILKKSTNNTIQTKTSEAFNFLNSNNYEAALSKFKEVYALKPSEDIRRQIQIIENKIKENNSKKTSSNNTTKNSSTKKTTYTGNEKNNSTKKTSIYTKPKTTYNPKLTTAQKTAINNAVTNYQNNIQQKLREQDRLYEKRRQEQLKAEREYQNELRRERRKRIEENRRRREYVESQEKLLKQKQLKEEELYKLKGGDANYNRQINNFRSLATKEMTQINNFLRRYSEKEITLDIYNNCSYVAVVEAIQNADKMPVSYKSILISNLLDTRAQYSQTYKLYSKKGGNKDNLAYPECGNYLRSIYRGGFVNEKFDTSIFFGGDTYVINNKYDSREMAEGNYSIPRGVNNTYISFSQAISKSDISISNSKLKNFIYHIDLWKDFHIEPKKWTYKYNYKLNNRKPLLLTKEDILKEANSYKTFYQIQRKYSFVTDETEMMMALFNYHTGDYISAFDHYRIAILQRYGSYNNFISGIKNIKSQLFGEIYSGYNLLTFEKSEILLLGAILFFENNETDKSLEILKELSTYNSKFNKDKNNKNSINWNLSKLRNQIFYSLKEYDKMYLPKDEKSIKETYKWVKKNLKYQEPWMRKSAKKSYKIKTRAEYKIKHANEQREYLDYIDRPILANAYLKMGNTKLAKAIINETIKTYTKKGNIYYGTPLEIDAFKEVLTELYPKKKSDIKFRELTGYSLVDKIFSRKGLYIKRKLFRNKFLSPTYLKQDLTNVSTNTKWLELKSKTLDDINSKDELKEVFNTLLTIYNNGKLIKNETSKEFLEKLVDFGIVLGSYYEVLPAIFELQEYGELKNSLALKLSVLETDSENKEIGKWLEANKENVAIKQDLETYLKYKSKFKVSSHSNARLYSLY